jgi:C4-dicarboxylate-specific signal transduction histidine kinase
VSDTEDWGFASARYVQLQQVLVNLLNNAYYEVKKLEEQWIRVEIEHTQENVYIKVIDSGKGIPPEVAKKIMSPFYTTKPVGEGTGLGLSISKGVLETFDGDLFLDMDHKNTCFVIKLKQDINSESEKAS